MISFYTSLAFKLFPFVYRCLKNDNFFKSTLLYKFSTEGHIHSRSQGSNHLFQEDICLFSQLLCTLKGSQRAVILMLGKRVKEFLEGFSSNFLPFWGNKVFWTNSYMNVMDMLIAKCIFSE